MTWRFRGLGAVLLLVLSPAAAVAEAADPITRRAVSEGAFVLAEFVSESCPACDEMEPVVEAVLVRHPEVLHQVHDADREAALAARYEVRCVPVYVVVSPQGEVVYNDVGVRTREELEEILREAGAGTR